MKFAAICLFNLILTIVAQPALAQTVGYVRITVTSYMPHDFPLELSSNGVHIATIQHSDGNKGPTRWIPLRAEHLSSTSDQTPISAKPSWSSFDQCNFEFTIEFSSDGQTPTAPLGTFPAPTGNSGGIIPLGRKCGGKIPVCSSLQSLQNTLAWEYGKAVLKAYLGFRDNVDAGLKSRVASANHQVSQASTSLKQAPPLNVDDNERVLAEHIKSWQAEFEADQRRAKDSFELPSVNPNAPDKPSDLADAAIESAVQKQRVEGQQNSNEALGGVFFGPKSFDENIGLIAKQNRELLEADIADGLATQQEIRDQDRLERNIMFMRKYILRGHAFCHALEVVTKTVSSYVPELKSVERTMTAMEAIRGQELCPYGKTFTQDERAEKLCELGIEFGTTVPVIGKFLKEESQSADQKMVADKLKEKVQKGACGSLISYVTPK